MKGTDRVFAKIKLGMLLAELLGYKRMPIVSMSIDYVKGNKHIKCSMITGVQYREF